MARPESRYVCGNCGDAFLRWEGQCRTCGTWNSLVETVVHEPKRGARPPRRPTGRAGVDRAALWPAVGEPDAPRLPIGIGELDRVLGGGLVPGSVVLLGGEPGIGKSTLLLQALAGLVGGSAGRARGPLCDRRGVGGAGPPPRDAARAGRRAGRRADPRPRRARDRSDRRGGARRTRRRSSSSIPCRRRPSTSSMGAAGSVGQVREATLRSWSTRRARAPRSSWPAT